MHRTLFDKGWFFCLAILFINRGSDWSYLKFEYLKLVQATIGYIDSTFLELL